jgi:hypothetical protein
MTADGTTTHASRLADRTYRRRLYVQRSGESVFPPAGARCEKNPGVLAASPGISVEVNGSVVDEYEICAAAKTV